MSLVLNTNINSLVAQNSLTSSGSELSTALQQLSSGLRINTAADDAAGYAIVQGMTSQIGGLNQAAQNAGAGVSLAQTGGGALQEITNDLQSMRDLAVESLNATNSSTDRADLNQQYQQLVADIDNVAKTTSFNGVNLLDGSFQGAAFQIGANAGQTIQVASVASARTSTLGTGFGATVTGAGALTALVGGDLTVNGAAISASVAGGAAGQTTDSAYSIATAINASQDAVTAAANAATLVGAAPTTNVAINANTITINGVNVGAVAAGANAQAQGANIAQAINLVSAASGVTATSAANGAVTLTAADGRDILVAETNANGATLANTGFAIAGAATQGSITLTTTGNVGITLAGNNPTHSGIATLVTAASLTGAAISTTDVLSVGTANTALSSIDSALQAVATTGAQLGAYQDRFQAAITGLNTTATNLQSARSQIQDTNYAQATSDLSKAQILQQASTAMVAQANTVPQNVLTLLQKLP
jgi:flagellin